MPLTSLRWAVLAAAACHPAPPAPPKLANEVHRDEHVVVLAVDRTVRFVTIAPPAVTLARTVATPAEVTQMRWSGDVPVVMLSSDEDEVGRITPRGYERVPVVTEAAWGIAPPANPDDAPPRMFEIVGDGSAVYVSRCERGGFQDGGWCEKRVFAEVVRDGALVLPPRITRDEPNDLAMAPAPHVTPSPAITLELVDEPPDQVPDGADAPRKLLRCTRDGVTTQYPAPADRQSFLGMGPITWLRTEPPVYQVTETALGYDVITQQTTFEGCATSKTYAGARVATGPDELAVLFGGDRTSVLQGGHELAALDAASLALFRPEPD